MNIGFVGKGRVATAFAQFFSEKNIQICGFHTRTNPNFEILSKCDIVFIATPDDAISTIANEIMPTAKVYCHFSGTLSSDVLLPLAKNGAAVCSLHPAMTFAGNVDLASIAYTFEGSGERIDEFMYFLNSCDIKPIIINTKDKPLYHAAMCNASNHITTLIYLTFEMLKKLHISKEEIISLIAPLSKIALENALNLSPEVALTGPISRGDVETIKAHIPFVDETYTNLAMRTVDLAFSSGRIDEQKAKIIMEVLKNGNNNT